MNATREKVITDIEHLWSYICFLRYKLDEKFPLEELYYMHVLYEYMYEVVTEYEEKGIKPNDELLEGLKECVDNFNNTILHDCKETMTRDNKCNFFFEEFYKNKELSVILKKTIERDYKLYSHNIHNKVYVMHEYIHEGVDDIITLVTTLNNIVDKLIDIIKRCDQLWT